MPDATKFSNFEDWQSACRAAGLDGPYRISGQPHMWQFVRKEGGTAAMFNTTHGTGFIHG